ncbi:MAG: T9SS type A sorting domain-containing protein [Flavobacteriia bacterium]
MSLILLCSIKLFSQNHAVINPPYYIDNLLGSPILKTLPIPTTISLNPGDCSNPNIVTNDPEFVQYGYDGQLAMGASNMMLDTNGRILFFVVDGIIYNSKGITRGIMPGTDDGSYRAYGANEITIVPDPGDCDQYYLLTNRFAEGTQAIATSPIITVYNTASETIVQNYSLYSQIGQSNPGLFPNLNGTEITALGSQRWATPAIASTELQDDGHYYVVFSLTTQFLVVKIGNGGIEAVNRIDKTIAPNAALGSRPIMEIFVDPVTKNKKIAVNENSGANSDIYIYEYNPDFSSQISYRAFSLNDYVIDENQRAYVKGLEFSPNGDYLYFTHLTSSLVSGQFKYINLLNNSINNIIVPSNFNVQNSEIESRKIEVSPNVFVRSLMLAYGNGILNYSLPDNPGTGSFSTILNFTNSFNYGVELNVNQTNLRRYYQLPDQIDNMDYTQLKYIGYDASNYEACVSSTWQPNTFGNLNNNPFSTSLSNTVYIKDELRIPAGVNLTIQNMTFVFAPTAKVIVENGTSSTNGGKLTLINSKFTADLRCEDDMWLGVEVWGNTTLPQGNIGSSKQGRLVLNNNSTIEHAFYGALNAQRSNPTLGTSTPLVGTGGGIIVASNSSFLNNYVGVKFAPYTQMNSVSLFTKCKFEWNAPLKNTSYAFNTHAFVQNTNGIKFIGNEFNNLMSEFSGLNNLGTGIYARNSNFSVIPWCADLNCTSMTKNKFFGLNFGANVFNYNGSPFVIDRSLFERNYRGIYALYATKEKISRNEFRIIDKTFQTYGLYLNRSTGYFVQENTFFNIDNPNVPFSQALTYGIIANNSGVAKNLIYKNDFTRLLVGGQSEHINGVLITDLVDNGGNASEMQGLQWKCNRFYETKDHDFFVVNGIIDRNQGTVITANPVLYAARNQFSLSLNNEPSQHDFRVYNSQLVDYVYLQNSNHFPNSITTSTSQSITGIVHPIPAINNNSQPVYMTTTGCPSNIINPGAGLSGIHQNINNINEEIAALKLKLDLGSSEDLLNGVRNNNLGQMVQELVSRSPYLSDDILEAFMDRNPNSGQLKQILILNSALNKRIKDKLEFVSMPVGSRNQINAKQTGENPRLVLQKQIAEMEKEKRALENSIITESLTDFEDLNHTNAIAILEGRNTLEADLELFDIYLRDKNVQKQIETRTKILTRDNSVERNQLTAIEINIASFDDRKIAFETEQSFEQNLIIIKNGSLNDNIRKKIDSYLADVRDSIVSDTIYYYPIEKGNFSTEPNNEIIIQNQATFLAKIYPNPSTGLVNLDFANIPDGVMDINIYDLAGKLVYQNTFENTNGEQINLAEMHKGLYLVKILIDKQVVEVQKLELK